MEQENKDIKATVKQEPFPEIDDALKEIDDKLEALPPVYKDKTKELKSFYKRLIIGEAAFIGVAVTLLIVSKNHEK